MNSTYKNIDDLFKAAKAEEPLLSQDYARNLVESASEYKINKFNYSNKRKRRITAMNIFITSAAAAAIGFFGLNLTHFSSTTDEKAQKPAITINSNDNYKKEMVLPEPNENIQMIPVPIHENIAPQKAEAVKKEFIPDFKDNKIDVKGVHLIELTPEEVANLGIEVHNGSDCDPYLEFVTKFGEGFNKIEMYPDRGTMFQFINDTNLINKFTKNSRFPKLVTDNAGNKRLYSFDMNDNPLLIATHKKEMRLNTNSPNMYLNTETTEILNSKQKDSCGFTLDKDINFSENENGMQLNINASNKQINMKLNLDSVDKNNLLNHTKVFNFNPENNPDMIDITISQDQDDFQHELGAINIDSLTDESFFDNLIHIDTLTLQNALKNKKLFKIDTIFNGNPESIIIPDINLIDDSTGLNLFKYPMPKMKVEIDTNNLFRYPKQKDPTYYIKTNNKNNSINMITAMTNKGIHDNRSSIIVSKNINVNSRNIKINKQNRVVISDFCNDSNLVTNKNIKISPDLIEIEPSNNLVFTQSFLCDTLADNSKTNFDSEKFFKQVPTNMIDIDKMFQINNMIPLVIRMGKNPNVSRINPNPDFSFILWYEPTPELIEKLPARYRDQLKQEYAALLNKTEACSSAPKTGEDIYFDSFRACSGAIENLRLFPNPSDGKFEVKFNITNERFLSISLHDLSGRLIRQLENSFSMKTGDFDRNFVLEDTPAGVYLVVVQSEKGEQAVQRLIVK